MIESDSEDADKDTKTSTTMTTTTSTTDESSSSRTFLSKAVYVHRFSHVMDERVIARRTLST